MMQESKQEVLDLIGIGLGPFNLGLAAMLTKVPTINALFFEQKPEFDWHPGLLIEGTTLQVPFFADLVTMADPTSPYTFLNYLKEHNRLYHFYFLERFLIPRREYNHYCQWVSKQLDALRFSSEVVSVVHHESKSPALFEVTVKDTQTQAITTYWAKDVVIGVGSVPTIPIPHENLSNDHVFHSANFLQRFDELTTAESITVIGSGQSAAEVFLTLLQAQPEHGYRIDWFTRSSGFFPMEYSKLGLEHFSPDYIDYFFQLPQAERDALFKRQGLLYKGISASTIATIYELLYERTVGEASPPVRLLAHTEVQNIVQTQEAGRITYELSCYHKEQKTAFTHDSDRIVMATGYQHKLPSFIASLDPFIDWDAQGRYQVDAVYQVQSTKQTSNRIFVQNGELHTHGIGAPDLGLGAHRNAVIINQLTGTEFYPVQKKNVFQQFGVSPAQVKQAETEFVKG
ncbi:lysine N(6)-hydroxylase/L-ornithine N(5)-oxygenase family protein [Hazenella sp. IB182357]|uniref:L-lysine N6-monooxygenase MbtG n=1 Tax=Polycladospora coralii TaxID=2771432 RepID=A0A926RU29_9BACL|nr:lysine N(6)-hydroxylase/L-ornithine N(5)-oxygenase family protein [Polycladospora coralii]MBD1371879.1 lysine N(6)-hydroxylase/L-ornithine N(5)-oxygenase family protein [Polycladospora coralii]MBS7529340.1 lysine N(6)-hydroxylase/L-ornithine N(5)-oxygenase family protein [Polycladospora coralii]